MTKYSTNKKALKAILAGAVAFTPVLAVGVNVEKASAATTDEQFITYLKGLYQTTAFQEQDNLEKLEIASNELKDVFVTQGKISTLLDPNLTIDEEDAATAVLSDFFTVLNSLVPNQDIDADYASFKTNQENNIRLLFGNDVTADEIANFAFEVQLDYFNSIRGAGTGASTEFYILAYATALTGNQDHAAYSSLEKILIDSTEMVAALNALKDEPGLVTAVAPALPILKQALNEVNPPSSGGGIGGGGGGIPAPGPVTGGEVPASGSDVEANPQDVIDAINEATTVKELTITLEAGTEVVSIPATILTALENKNGESTVVIVAGDATYEVPVSQINLSAAATKLGVASAELILKVTIDEVTNPLAGKAIFKTLSEAIDFKLSIIAPDGKSVELKYFSKPVQRSIATSTNLNPLTTVGVVVNANGTVVAVPTFIPATAKSAVLYRNSNSVYTLIENSKTFKDVDKGASWAEEYVEKLASRMVVNGVNNDSFKPSQLINRGEFAAILSRGLGLVAEDTAAKDFKDVSLSQGFNKNGEIAAVVDAGLVKGFEDGNFRPYEEITRDQAAIMISRAIDYINSDLVKLDSAKKLSNFKDVKEIGAASRTHVEKVYQAGYLEGFTDNTFRPSSEANRAQMAKILYNFLESIEYIN